MMPRLMVLGLSLWGDRVDIDSTISKKIITQMAQGITAQQTMLSQLDATVGDGDHGHNLARAFDEANRQVQALVDPDLPMIWRTTGQTIRDSIGGASGLLFGAFFSGIARTLAGKEQATINDIGPMLEAGLAAVQKRGKATPGDKTIVDALAPAVGVAQNAVNNTQSLAEVLEQIAEAAQRGAEATQDMVARHGRAKFLGERAKGYQDAGATSMALLLKAWAETIKETV